MKIVTREEFMKLPEDTIYAKGKEWYFEGIFIKGHTIKDFEDKNIDWYFIDPHTTPALDSMDVFIEFENSLKNNSSFEGGFNILQRDGSFDSEDLFMIWEEQDKQVFKRFLE